MYNITSAAKSKSIALTAIEVITARDEREKLINEQLRLFESELQKALTAPTVIPDENSGGLQVMFEIRTSKAFHALVINEILFNGFLINVIVSKCVDANSGLMNEVEVPLDKIDGCKILGYMFYFNVV